MSFHPHLSKLFEFRTIYLLGFFAQLLFFSRMLVQWVLSEKHKKSVSPQLFWVLSLVGSCAMMVYGFLRLDVVIVGGQLITYCVYIRNLTFQDFWESRIKRVLFWCVLVVPFVGLGVSFLSYHRLSMLHMFHIPSGLFMLGAAGQAVFNGRFIYQWLYSEKRKESIFPLGFWLLSFVGSLLLIIYAVRRHDLVLFLGQTFGMVIYIRNLVFFRRVSL